MRVSLLRGVAIVALGAPVMQRSLTRVWCVHLWPRGLAGGGGRAGRQDFTEWPDDGTVTLTSLLAPFHTFRNHPTRET